MTAGVIRKGVRAETAQGNTEISTDTVIDFSGITGHLMLMKIKEDIRYYGFVSGS